MPAPGGRRPATGRRGRRRAVPWPIPAVRARPRPTDRVPVRAAARAHIPTDLPVLGPVRREVPGREAHHVLAPVRLRCRRRPFRPVRARKPIGERTPRTAAQGMMSLPVIAREIGTKTVLAPNAGKNRPRRVPR